MKTELIVSFISELLALANLFFVFLHLKKKLNLHGIITWLAIAINSTFVSIAQIVIAPSIKIPIILPIFSFIGTFLLSICLSILIYKMQKNTKK